MNSNRTKDSVPTWRYSRITVKDFTIAVLISKFYWTKVFINKGTSSQRIRFAFKTNAIVPIYSIAGFFRFFYLSSQVRSSMGSRIILSLSVLIDAIIPYMILTLQNNSNMYDQQDELENAEHKPLSIRIKHLNWLIRKRAYQQILEIVFKVKSINEEFNIQGETFTVTKFIAFLNNLVEEKHPNVLLKGLQCAEAILRLDSKTGKFFNKLVVQGLQKFPLLTQQRAIVLEKFLEILELSKIEPSVLNNRLNLPHEKSVMFVIEVIGALQMVSLKGKLLQISKKHPKKCVKQLASEIAAELGGEQQLQKVKQQDKKVKGPSKNLPAKNQERKKAFRMQLIDKLPQFEQMIPKDQQRYSQQLLDAIEEISLLPPSGSLSSFSYYIQLMIEFNNQIISTNGVKILTCLINNKSQLITSSFPLLFLFRKFKTHKTHATNANLLNLVQALLCSNRSHDLMNAILQGLGSQQNKANLKYGCIVSFIRVFCYYFRQQDLFSTYCIGEYTDLCDKIENKRIVEKMLYKCFQVFSKQNAKDKDYIPAIEQMKNILGLTSSITSLPTQKYTKQIGKIGQNKSTIPSTKNLLKTQQLPKKSIASSKSTSKGSLIVSPQGQFGKIIELLQSNKVSESILNKATQKCLDVTKKTLQQNVFDMYYFCQIAESFIQKYIPNQQTDETISHFLIQYLKVLSTAQIKPTKKNSKITETGLQYLLKLSTSKLVLSKELVFILKNILKSFGFEMIAKCLGSIYVMGGHVLKKKNKKYLMRWLEENASQEYVNSQYFEIIQAIQNSGEKNIQKVNLQIPPSIKNLPVQANVNNAKGKSKQKQDTQQAYEQQNFKITMKATYKEDPIFYVPIKNKSHLDQLQTLENADISQIQKVEEQYTDRLDEKWQYFLNKKGGAANTQNPIEVLKKTQNKAEFTSQDEQEKYNIMQNNESLEKSNQYYNPSCETGEKFEASRKQQKIEVVNNWQPKNASNKQIKEQKIIQPSFDSQQQELNMEKQHQDAEQQSQQDQLQFAKKDEEQQQKVVYKFLNHEKIIYMINNSTNPFNHFRTLILIPFKSQQNKHLFLRQLTHIIQSQKLQKPQPFKSMLLIIILLFTEIKTNKTIIEPLQYLYEYMAQHCANNQFLKIIISLYHSVIDQTQQLQRKLLLTILTKSMTRIMPFVQNALQLLKDFQQFYQIGQMVYFEMFTEEYNQIKQVIEHCDSLQQVIHKAFDEEGQSLVPIIEGWLQTGFKNVVKSIVERLISESEEN